MLSEAELADIRFHTSETGWSSLFVARVDRDRLLDAYVALTEVLATERVLADEWRTQYRHVEAQYLDLSRRFETVVTAERALADHLAEALEQVSTHAPNWSISDEALARHAAARTTKEDTHVDR